jgi:hypothetical protein
MQFSFVRRTLLVILAVFTLSPTASGQRRRRGGRPPSTAACQAALRSQLDGITAQVGQCAVAVRRFRQIQVHVRVTVDTRGTIVNLDTSALVDETANDTAARCVETAVRDTHFTGCSNSSLMEAQRDWTFRPTRRDAGILVTYTPGIRTFWCLGVMTIFRILITEVSLKR